MRRLVFLALFFTLPILADDKSCDPEKEDCTVGGAIAFYRSKGTVDAIAQEVVSANRATTAPDAFAARVHNSYQDFLNQLSFAINKVEESGNGQALIIRFNPLRTGSNLFGLTLTLSKPGVAEAVRTAIPEATRDATVKALEKQLQDTDDQTWSASYSYATDDCPQTGRRCWGRNPKTYRVLLSVLLPPSPSLSADQIADLTEELAKFFPDDQKSIEEFKLSEAKEKRNPAINKIKAIVAAEQASAAPARALFERLHLGLLPTLIDNQPQITATGSWHNPGLLGGAKERSATLELHAGRENINTLRTECATRQGDFTECLQNTLDRMASPGGLSTDKFVATFTYKQVRAYRLGTLPLGQQITGFVPVDTPHANDYKVKVQAGRQLGTEVMGKPLRADLAFEGEQANVGPERKTNRWVGTLTISVPLGENITVPVTLTYANKPAFLGDPNDRIGAHIGLSYRIPNLLGGQP